MNIEQEILINQYGQDLIDLDQILFSFENLPMNDKGHFMNEIIFLIMQSKPKEEDIGPAILKSKLRPTYTPCVLLRKGVANHHLLKITRLPENEWIKVLTLLLSLFSIAYKRRFEAEKNNPDKWWYWDLSDKNKVDQLRKQYTR